MLDLDDNSPMPCGKKYKGTPLKDVPDSYLLWWHDTVNKSRIKVMGRDNQMVQNYIRENLDAIKENLKK